MEERAEKQTRRRASDRASWKSARSLRRFSICGFVKGRAKRYSWRGSSAPFRSVVRNTSVRIPVSGHAEVGKKKSSRWWYKVKLTGQQPMLPPDGLIGLEI